MVTQPYRVSDPELLKECGTQVVMVGLLRRGA